MKNIPLLIATILGTILMIVGVGWFFGQSSSGGSATSSADRTLLENDLQLVQGDPQTAQVVVVEFSDFQCPACRATAPLVEQLAEEYRGPVAFGFRHFPLESIHPNAFAAAVAAQAAHQQGAFWPMHDKLFAKQDEWEAVTNEEELRSLFASYAIESGIDEAQFRQALDQQDLVNAVRNDMAIGNQLRVSATPTFFVNGVSVTANNLREAIESALAESMTEVQIQEDVELIEVPSATESATE